MKIVEAHQFKGVFPDPAKVAMAEHETDPELKAKLLARPPFDGKQSIQFTTTGLWFDVQEDHVGQYMNLPADPPGSNNRGRVDIGDWIVLLSSGRYIKMTDEEYKAETAS